MVRCPAGNDVRGFGHVVVRILGRQPASSMISQTSFFDVSEWMKLGFQAPRIFAISGLSKCSWANSGSCGLNSSASCSRV